jgi:hypothetical protein
LLRQKSGFYQLFSREWGFLLLEELRAASCELQAASFKLQAVSALHVAWLVYAFAALRRLFMFFFVLKQKRTKKIQGGPAAAGRPPGQRAGYSAVLKLNLGIEERVFVL